MIRYSCFLIPPQFSFTTPARGAEQAAGAEVHAVARRSRWGAENASPHVKAASALSGII
jgi:hypothetical protein